MSNDHDDFSTRFLGFLHDCLPAPLEPWNEALIAELAAIDGFWPRLRWSLGGTSALLRVWLQQALNPKHGRRFTVNLIAGYHFLFSAVLIGVITWQVPQITEPLKDAIPVLVMCYALATLPAILGFGLALRDNAARTGAILFTVAHALLNIAYIRRGLAPHAEFTGLRVAADIAIIVILNLPAVRRAFEVSPIALHLKAGESVSPES